MDMVMLCKVPALRLLAYTQTPNSYQVLPPDERGWIRLALVRIWLGVEQHEIVYYHETSQLIGDYRALAEALAAETQAPAEATRWAETEVWTPAAAEAASASRGRRRSGYAKGAGNGTRRTAAL